MQMPAATKKGGAIAGGPNVCKTPPAPPVPVPYPTLAKVAGTDKAVSKVVISNKETVIETSKIPNSKGDEAGTLKGLVSSTCGSSVQYKKYSPKVYAKGKKIVFHTGTIAGNSSNANCPVGVHGQASQSKVSVAT